MQIFVKTVTGRTVPLSVESSDKVENVRLMVQERLELHSSRPVLIFDRKKLEDICALSDYNIQERSIIYLIEHSQDVVQIFVKTLTGMTITVEAKVSDTVESVKSKAYAKANIPSSQEVVFIYAGQQMQEDRILSDYNIQNESTLHMVMHFSDKKLNLISVEVRGYNKPILHEVEATDDIETIKSKIQGRLGIPPYQQRLMFADRELKGRRKLSDYKIQKDSTLRLEFFRMKIHVRTSSRKTVTLDVDASDTIQYVKSKVQDTDMSLSVLPEQWKLVFNGQQLNDAYSLVDYNIQDEAILDLTDTSSRKLSDAEHSIIKLSDILDRMRIFVKYHQKTITLKVMSSYTVETVKYMICDEEGISPDQQKLFFGKKQLQNDHTLYDYDIEEEAILDLTDTSSRKLSDAEHSIIKLSDILDRMRIFVKYHQKTITLKVMSSYTVETVKYMICDEEGILPDQQKLFFGKKQLQNDHTLYDYDIEEESTLDLHSEAIMDSSQEKHKDNQNTLYSARLYRKVKQEGPVSAVFCICLDHPSHIQHCNRVISNKYAGMTDKGEGLTATAQLEFVGEENLIMLHSIDTPGFDVTFDLKPARILKCVVDIGIDTDLSQLPESDYPPRLMVFVKQHSSSCSLPSVKVTGLNIELVFCEIPVLDTSQTALFPTQTTSFAMSSEPQRSQSLVVGKSPSRNDGSSLTIKGIDDSINRDGFNSMKSCCYHYEDYSCSALMVASLRGLYDVSKHILKKASEIGVKEVKTLLNQQNDNGLSSLMFASIKGHPDVASLLLKEGAQVDLQDKEGHSALMYACKNGQYDAAKLLLSSGADVDLQSCQWESALSIALERQNDLISLLQKRINETQDPVTSANKDPDEEEDSDHDEQEYSEWKEVEIPLSLNTLTLFKYKERDGRRKCFRLVSMVSARWKIFGRLVKLCENQLDALDQQYRGDATTCWCKVMQTWMETNPYSWETLHGLLKDAECVPEAKKLRRALFLAIQPPPPQVTVRTDDEDCCENESSAAQQRWRRCSLL